MQALIKTPRRKNKKSLDSARGQDCIKCQINDNTTVSAHYSGICQMELGKGMGSKLSDILSAYLCYKCHYEFDQYRGITGYKEKLERSEEFLDLVFATIRIKIRAGIVKIPDNLIEEINQAQDFWAKIEAAKRLGEL